MTEHEFKVIEQMSARGGSFVKSLAECFRHADQTNFAKLKTTFSEYWARYEVMQNDRANH